MRRIRSGRLLDDVGPGLREEQCATLLAHGGVRFERIVSLGHTTPPPGTWYDQAWDEWVMVVVGAAEVLVDGEATPCRLEAGDWLFLPRHVRHRVGWTDPARPTAWLAIHVGEP